MSKRKVLAILIAVAYLVCSVTIDWPSSFFGTLFLVSFALVFILFSELAGRYKGIASFHYVRFVRITKESPPVMVEFMGWLFLFFPILIYFLVIVNFA